MYNTGRRLSVLVVNQYYPPDTSATAGIFADLTSAFADAGHEVAVLCGRPSYRPRERRSWRPLRIESGANGEVVERVGSAALEMRSLRMRGANYASFLGLASVRAAFRPRADVVVAGTDPPLAVIVALLAARGRPVVYHLQDLHPQAAVAAGWLSPGRLAAMWQRVHAWALRRCALVACLGRDMAAHLAANGVPEGRLVVVPNGARPPSGTPDDTLVERLRGRTPFVVMHAGNLGVAGAFDTLVRAARLLEGEVGVVFVGGGAREQELRDAGVRVEPFESDVNSLMAAADVQLVTQRTEMLGLLVPSKLYTALSHGRPVLAVAPAESELAATVRESQCGVVADPNDPEDVAAKIRELAANPEALEHMARRASDAGRRYDRGAVFADFVSRVERLVAEP